MDWQDISTAPKDGTPIRLGWLVNGVVEFRVPSHWRHRKWHGDWTPTHWQPIPKPNTAEPPA